MSHNYAKNLKAFANALASDKFKSNEEIKQEMDKLGLIYSDNEIERLNNVLLALHPFADKIRSKHSKPNQRELRH